jgi:hypothetical protein
MRGRDRQPDGICVPCSTALFDRAAVKWQARLALERPALRLPDIRGISADMTDFEEQPLSFLWRRRQNLKSERPAGWRASLQIKLL